MTLQGTELLEIIVSS